MRTVIRQIHVESQGRGTQGDMWIFECKIEEVLLQPVAVQLVG